MHPLFCPRRPTLSAAAVLLPLFALLSCSVTVAPGIESEESSLQCDVLCGDIDGNGRVSVTDGVLALRAAAGLEAFTECQHLAADVNRDGQVTVSDGVLIQRAAAGLEQLTCNPAHTDALRAPAALRPANADLLPWGQTSVVLGWQSVPSATSYSLRVNDNTDSTLRLSASECASAPQYLCRSNLRGMSYSLPVRDGHSYTWSVRACDAQGCSNATTASFAVVRPSGSLNNSLTCGIPWAASLPTTAQISMRGHAVDVNLGINGNLGGVGVKFELINKLYPQSAVNIAETRSAAGAGWQFTDFIYAHSGENIIFNQAAGNAVGIQWGAGNRYVSSSGSTLSYLSGVDWSPVYSDTVAVSGSRISTSPCSGDPAPYRFELGRLHLSAAPEETSTGNTIAITNRYELRSTMDQAWQGWFPVQAFYFPREVARRTDFRFYAVGRSRWTVGPVRPFEALSENQFMDRHGVLRATQIDTGNVSTIGFPIDLDYVMWIFNVAGLDIGVVARDIQRGGTLRLEKTTYCSDPGRDVCGNINWIGGVSASTNFQFSAGEVRSYQQKYLVGTLQQLRSLGFDAPYRE